MNWVFLLLLFFLAYCNSAHHSNPPRPTKAIRKLKRSFKEDKDPRLDKHIRQLTRLSNQSDGKVSLFELAIKNKLDNRIANQILASKNKKHVIDMSAPPIHNAVWCGDWNSLRTILKHDKTAVNARSPYDQRTALHLAAEKGSSLAVTMLLSFGACVNSFDVDGRSPIHIAATNGKGKVVFRLCEKTTIEVINHQDKHKDTALHLGVEGAYLSVVKSLIQFKGLKTKLRNKQNKTPLQLAEDRIPTQEMKKVIEKDFKNKSSLPTPTGYYDKYLKVIKLLRTYE